MNRNTQHTTPAPGDRTPFWGTTLYSMIGVILWTLHFGFVYGISHVVCSPALAGRADSLGRALILGGTVPILVLIALAGLWPERTARLFRVGTMSTDTAGFLHHVARFICLLSFLGVAWAGAAALILPVCAG